MDFLTSNFAWPAIIASLTLLYSHFLFTTPQLIVSMHTTPSTKTFCESKQMQCQTQYYRFSTLSFVHNTYLAAPSSTS
jgi:hypothetical protein